MVDLYAEGPDDSHITGKVLLGSGVKLMECKYKCGGYFVVTTMTRNPPHHFECGIAAMLECQRQMRAKSGPYYDRWLATRRAQIERSHIGLSIWLQTHDHSKCYKGFPEQ